MAIGSKAKYTEKQKRKAQHIEESYEQQGVSASKAAEIAWATVNKQSGGGELSGSGKNVSATRKTRARKDSARSAAATKRAKSNPHALESQTKADLLAMARDLHISGRSSMSKPDLILALRQNQKTH